MPPKKDLASVLFHQKKKPVKDQQKPPNGAPRKPRPPPKPAASPKPDAGLELPDGPFSEFKLYSSALNGWKYDVMKFDSRKPVDIQSWQEPIKLNRKDLHRDDAVITAGPPDRPMLGLDGKPVVGADGKMVMVDAEGRVASNDPSGKGKGPAGPAKKKFQKKTRQVYLVPEERKQLRKEERYPWVIEDNAGQEVWTAQLDDTTKAEMHCFFMPAANDIFKFVPAHRWYKFQKKLNHNLPVDTVTVESAYQKHQKRDPTVWLHQRTGRGPSEQTAAMFKAEADGTNVDFGKSLVHSSSSSLGPGGRKLKMVDSGGDLFGDDEEGEGGRRQRKELGGDGDMDEMLDEEQPSDDEEKMDVDNEDEEAKELEERLKKEYKSANKTREGYIDQSDEEEDTPKLSKEQRKMQKLIRNREGNDAYESDDEKNPYASSEESSDEEEVPPMTQPNSQNNETPNPSQAQSQPTPGPQPPAPAEAVSSDVRATSPGSPSLGGHSILARRATSPKPPKIRARSPSGNSPLASRAGSPNPAAHSRAGSPNPAAHSRASSPVAGSSGSKANGSRASSPVNGKKRKAEDTNGSTSPGGAQNGVQPPKAKKRKATAAPAMEVAVPTGPLEDYMLIEWLKKTPDASTRTCIHYFKPYLTDGDKQRKFTTLVKEVATLNGGTLRLRPQFAGMSAPQSPAS